LVRRLRELPIDARYRFALSDDQATDVLGEMPTLAIVLKELPKLLYALLHHRRPLDDPWHPVTLRGSRTPPVAISLATGRRAWRPARRSGSRAPCEFCAFLPILPSFRKAKTRSAKLQF
jgi:hypothetical protein